MFGRAFVYPCSLLFFIACGDGLTEHNIFSGIVSGTITSRSGLTGIVGIRANAYRTCADTTAIAAGVGATVDSGHYTVTVVGPVGGTSCLVVSAVRKTSTQSDSVVAPPEPLILRDPQIDTVQSLRVDILMP